jgi:hypothetical protein
MAAAYTLSERSFEQYRDAVKEKFGEKKEQDVRDDTLQAQMNSRPLGNREVVVMTGKVLCFDGWSSRYFESTAEDIKFAVNKINHRIVNDNYASLTDFYHELGLSPTQESNDIGWNVDKLLDVHIGTTLSDKGEPALAIEYRVVPIRDYFRLH